MISKTMLLSLVGLLLSFAVNAQNLCDVSASSLQRRYEFLTDLKNQNQQLLRLAKRTHRLTRENLSSMKNAHLASDIAQVISAAAGLVAGGAAIGTLYFQGGSVSFMGVFTIQSGTVAAHAYSSYAIGSNLLTLGQVGYNVLKNGESVDQLLQRQMRQLSQQGLFSEDAVKFVFDPNWSGSSVKLRSPIIEQAVSKLQDFYEKKKEEIGDKDSLWGYIGEFWHERGLKTAALDEAVTKEMKRLQEMRTQYIGYLRDAIAEHHRVCYR